MKNAQNRRGVVRRKALALLMALALVATMLPAQVFAAGAEIPVTTFEALQQAIEDATDGDSIIVEADITLDESLSISTKELTLVGAVKNGVDETDRYVLTMKSGLDGRHLYYECFNGDLTIENLIFQGNDNGGIEISTNNWNGYTYLSMSKVTVQDCVSAGNGGGLFLNAHSGAYFVDCHFLRNTGLNGGGAYSCGEAELIFDGCSFVGNEATGYYGGGGFAKANTMNYWQTTFTNSTLEGNTAREGGGITAPSLDFIDGGLKDNIATGDGMERRPHGAGAYVYHQANFFGPDLVIEGNTFRNQAGLGGAIYAGMLAIAGDNSSESDDDMVLIENNGTVDADMAGAYAGGAVYVASEAQNSFQALDLQHVNFLENYASQHGGAVFTINHRLNIDSCQFNGNQADTEGEFLSSGGALYVASITNGYVPSRAMDPGGQAHRIVDTEFNNNSADRGGALLFDSIDNTEERLTALNIQGSSFVGNTAWLDGGAIYLTNGAQNELFIGFDDPGENVFKDNQAVNGDGGAIWADPGRKSENLSRIWVEENTSFTGNQSAQGQEMSPWDSYLHSTRIKATQFSGVWQTAYNNDDIAYWSGQAPYAPRVIYQAGYSGTGGPTIDSSAARSGDRVAILSLNATEITPDDGWLFTYWMDDNQQVYKPGDIITLYDDLILTAQWVNDANEQFTIEYYANQGDNSVALYEDPNTYGQHELFTVGVPEGNLIPPTGMKLAYWSLNAEDNLGEDFRHLDGSETTPGETYQWDGTNNIVTFYAQYVPTETEVVTYTLTYDNNHPDTSKHVTHDAGSYLFNNIEIAKHYGEIFDPAPDGFMVFKWNTKADGSGADWYPHQHLYITSDTILYAQWNQSEFRKITYDANGGEGTLIDPNIYAPGKNAIVIDPAGAITKEGHQFVKWTLDAEGEETPSYLPGHVIAMDDEDIVLYAQWEEAPENTYTVTYHPNHGSGTLPDPDSPYQTGSEVTVLANAFTRSGYRFTGWSTNQDGTGDSYSAEDTFTMGEENVILYAQWRSTGGGGTTTPDSYSVTYRPNGGVGSLTDNNSYEKGDKVTVLAPGTAITRTDYRFTGWNTSSGGSGTDYDPGGTFTISSNVTLYAQWEKTKDCVITYDANEGSGTLTDGGNPYQSGEKATVLSPVGHISRSGYGFTTWNTKGNGSGDTYKVGASLVMEEDITLYAQWRKFSDPTNPGTELPEPIPPLGDWEFNLDEHYAYLVGYPDGMVKPNGDITREETATIFFRLLTEWSRNALLTRDNPFSDVPSDRWSNTAVSSLAAGEILEGYPNGTFGPSNGITRAEFAAVAARFDSHVIDTHVVFTDTAGHWAEDFISRAACLGWIQGNPDGSFGPDNYITRAEASAIVNRMLLRLVTDESALLSGMKTWPDNSDKNLWYYLDIQEATNSHLFERLENSIYEQWLELMEDYDWKSLEKPVQASLPGGGLTNLALGSARNAVAGIVLARESALIARDITETFPAAAAEKTNITAKATVMAAKTLSPLGEGDYVRQQTALMPTINPIPGFSTESSPPIDLLSPDSNKVEISGTGVAGGNIYLILPDGSVSAAITVKPDGTWKEAVSISAVNRSHNGFVGAVQRMDGMKQSAMATRALYCVTQVEIMVEPMLDGTETKGTAYPHTTVQFLLYRYSDDFYGFCETTTDADGNWSLSEATDPEIFPLTAVGAFTFQYFTPGCLPGSDEGMIGDTRR